MIGQKNLKNKINTLTNFPHSVLLVGEYGSEQDQICSYIANRFNFNEFDMTDLVNDSFIRELNNSHTSTLYEVDLNKISEREQNILLKVFEEPNDYSYFILMCENDTIALDTIKNRSYILKCDIYTKEDLNNLTNDSIILDVCSTPGQVELANNTDIKGLFQLCNTFINMISVANFSNALSIADKINFKDDYEKYDLRLFIKILSHILVTSNKIFIYNNLLKMNNYIWSMNDKKRAFENFLTNVWIDSRLV